MKLSRQPIENTSWCSPFSMAFKTLMGSATSITFRTEKDSIRDTSRPTIIPPSSCPHSATKWHSSGTTDTQLTSKKNRRIVSINLSIYQFNKHMWKSLVPWIRNCLNETAWTVICEAIANSITESFLKVCFKSYIILYEESNDIVIHYMVISFPREPTFGAFFVCVGGN